MKEQLVQEVWARLRFKDTVWKMRNDLQNVAELKASATRKIHTTEPVHRFWEKAEKQQILRLEKLKAWAGFF